MGGTSSTTGEITTTEGSGGELGTTTGDVVTTGMIAAGGTAGSGGSGSGYACDVEMTGTHVHPLTIPGGDVSRGYQDAPYLLEQASGHTHTLTVSVYEFLYLQGGTTVVIESSTTESHSHTCSITCSAE